MTNEKDIYSLIYTFFYCKRTKIKTKKQMRNVVGRYYSWLSQID